MSNNILTWGELKKIVNEMPEEFLQNQVYAWNANDADPQGLPINSILKLQEDYVYDGDEGCDPLSIAKESGEYDPDEHYIVHHAGTIILIYTHESSSNPT